MTEERQQLIMTLQRIINEQQIEGLSTSIVNRTEEVIDAAKDYMFYITPRFANEEIGKLMYRLTNSPDESNDRKVLCGLTLGVLMGVCKFTNESSERLIAAFHEMLLSEDQPILQTSIVTMIRQSYLETKETSNVF